MAKHPLPDADSLRNLFAYDGETGLLSFKPRPREMFRTDKYWRQWNTRFSGREALSAIGSNGYKHGPIGGRNFLAHRVIWKMVYGVDANITDHINGVRTDNRLCNLRSVTRQENPRNMRLRAGSRSGCHGVNFQYGAWVACIRDGPRNVYLGRFANVEDAIRVRKEAEKKRGYHPNHGANP